MSDGKRKQRLRSDQIGAESAGASAGDDRHQHTWCPDCGPVVPVDEDGCCGGCGATAVGDGADQAVRSLAELTRVRAVLRSGEYDNSSPAKTIDTINEELGCERRHSASLRAEVERLRADLHRALTIDREVVREESAQALELRAAEIEEVYPGWPPSPMTYDAGRIEAFRQGARLIREHGEGDNR